MQSRYELGRRGGRLQLQGAIRRVRAAWTGEMDLRSVTALADQLGLAYKRVSLVMPRFKPSVAAEIRLADARSLLCC